MFVLDLFHRKCPVFFVFSLQAFDHNTRKVHVSKNCTPKNKRNQLVYNTCSIYYFLFIPGSLKYKYLCLYPTKQLTMCFVHICLSNLLCSNVYIAFGKWVLSILFVSLASFSSIAESTMLSSYLINIIQNIISNG